MLAPRLRLRLRLRLALALVAPGAQALLLYPSLLQGCGYTELASLHRTLLGALALLRVNK